MVFRLTGVLLVELRFLFPFRAVFSTLDSSQGFQAEPAGTKMLYYHQKDKSNGAFSLLLNGFFFIV